MTQFPTPPFLTIGEILYEIATLGGLAQTSNDKDPLYNELKAFKDDRKRPGLCPKELMDSVLPNIEDRLALIWEMDKPDETRAMIAAIGCGIIQWFDMYTEFVVTTDASLLTRDSMLKEVLWPTYFSGGVALAMTVLNGFRPFADLVTLVTAVNPLGWYLKSLCSNGTSDFNKIAEYRAAKHNIDVNNARQTVDTWLNGTVPNLENCYEVLEALHLKNDLGKRFGIFLARILQKMPMEYRQHVINQIDPREDSSDIWTDAQRLVKNISLKIASQLNIGADRPYAKIQSALYEIHSNRPGALELISMLERQERTWEPIKDHTMHLIHWQWARFHVLSEEYDKAMERYILAYNYGANRDPDIYKTVIQEALILAAKLGKKRQVERFKGWLRFYFVSDWDEEKQSIDDRFEEVFPLKLRFDLKLEQKERLDFYEAILNYQFLTEKGVLVLEPFCVHLAYCLNIDGFRDKAPSPRKIYELLLDVIEQNLGADDKAKYVSNRRIENWVPEQSMYFPEKFATYIHPSALIQVSHDWIYNIGHALLDISAPIEPEKYFAWVDEKWINTFTFINAYHNALALFQKKIDRNAISKNGYSMFEALHLAYQLNIDFDKAVDLLKERHISYLAAKNQIDSAIESTFFLEAITLQECLISNCLYNFLENTGADLCNSTFNDLLKMIIANKDSQRNLPTELFKEIDKWRCDRNKSIHGFIVTKNGRLNQSRKHFKELSETTAMKGRNLCNLVVEWYEVESVNFIKHEFSALQNSLVH